MLLTYTPVKSSTAPPISTTTAARYYDPVLSRFASVDPIFDSPSPYAYVNGHPTTSTDPTGQAEDAEEELTQRVVERLRRERRFEDLREIERLLEEASRLASDEVKKTESQIRILGEKLKVEEQRLREQQKAVEEYDERLRKNRETQAQLKDPKPSKRNITSLPSQDERLLQIPPELAERLGALPGGQFRES